MNIRCSFLVAVAALVSFAICSVATDVTPKMMKKNAKAMSKFISKFSTVRHHRDVPGDKLKKIYQEINKYLEKNVKSDDAEEIMAKVMELYDTEVSRASIFSGISMTDTLYMLSDLPRIHWTMMDSYGRRALMQKIDSGLADSSRLREPNYPLTKLDRLIEYYAVQDAREGFYKRNWPRMDYGLKQLAYDNIDNYLIENLPRSIDIDANMAKAKEYLDSLDLKDGALAEALKQFLLMKSTLNEDQCNEQGFVVIFRNDLGTRGKGQEQLGQNLRRVDRIFQQVVKDYNKLCQPIIRKNIASSFKQLDRETYRRVLGLASSFYLSVPEYAQMVESLNQKEASEDFTIPLMMKYAKKQVQSIGKADELFRIEEMDSYLLSEYIKALYNADPSPKTFKKGWLSAEQAEEKTNQLLSRYLFVPCNNYLKVVGELMEIHLYLISSQGDVFGSRVTDDLTYHMARASYQACRFVTRNTGTIRKETERYIMAF